MIPKQYRKNGIGTGWNLNFQTPDTRQHFDDKIDQWDIGLRCFLSSCFPYPFHEPRGTKASMLILGQDLPMLIFKININATTHFEIGAGWPCRTTNPTAKKNSLGIWTSQLYLPTLDFWSSEETTPDIFPNHVGQFYVKYYYRFPYKYKL